MPDCTDEELHWKMVVQRWCQIIDEGKVLLVFL
jgi:hypothetical protein